MHSETNDGQTIICIVQYKDKIVVGKVVEAYRVNYNNMPYIFPADKVTSGETVKEAAVRIVKEALGVSVEVLEKAIERIHPLTQKKITYVICVTKENVPKIPNTQNADVSENVLIKKTDILKYIPNVYPALLKYLGVK